MQNWNNILSFIKIKLAAKINLLELSDDQIINELKEHALYEFSQYCPYKKKVTITNENRVYTDYGEQACTYKLPMLDNEPIIDVLEIIMSDGSSQFDSYTTDVIESIQQFGSTGDYGVSNSDAYFGMQDIVIANKFFDIARSLRPRNTWDFLPPDIVSFDEIINGAVVVVNTVHTNLATIMPDMYHVFKRLCLGYIQETLVALRAKYETVATPFGEIRLNFQKLQEDATNNLQFAREKLEGYPADHILTICI